jgi:hypothetical protein
MPEEPPTETGSIDVGVVSQPSDDRIRRALELAAEQHAGVLQSLEEQLLAIAAGERDRELRRTTDAVRAAQAEVARAARATGAAESERALAVLADALRDLDEADTLADIFGCVLRQAKALSGRAEIVMVDAGGAPHTDPGEAAEAAMTTGPSHAGLALPLTVAGHVVAVLYADPVSEPPDRVSHGWPRAIEILVRHASRCLEGLTARKASTIFASARP